MWKFMPRAFSQSSPIPAPMELCSWQKEGKGCSYYYLHTLVPANSTACPCLGNLSSQGTYTDPIVPPFPAHDLFPPDSHSSKSMPAHLANLSDSPRLCLHPDRTWRPPATSKRPSYSPQPGRLDYQPPISEMEKLRLREVEICQDLTAGGTEVAREWSHFPVSIDRA